MPSKLNTKLFASLVKKNKKFVISGHQGPDGDVIGSTLAFAHSLKLLKKTVLPFNHDGCPELLKFLPGSNLIKSEIPNSFKDAILITVDSGDLNRLGPKISQYGFKEIWNVDHHQSNTRFGKYNFIDVKAGSTGQVVTMLLSACSGFKITKPFAQNVFCTLSTDTGSFKYSNATPEVFTLASKLVKAGAQPDVISTSLYETYPQRRLYLLQKVMGSLKFEKEGRIAKLYITNKDLTDVGALSEDAEEFVNLPRGVKGVKIVVFIKEKSANQWKLSLRSRDNVDVLKIAQKFGGGGHKLAAGCTVDGSLSEVEEKINNVIDEVGVLK